MVRTSARLLTIGGAGLLPGLAGALLNLWPYKLSEWLGSGFARDATRISFARIMVGLVMFPAAYGLAGAWLVLHRHVSMPVVATLLAASALFGPVALAYFKWVKRERHRLRLAWLAWTRRSTVARIRMERRRLIRHTYVHLGARLRDTSRLRGGEERGNASAISARHDQHRARPQMVRPPARPG